MIAKIAPARKSGHASFADLRNYLEYDGGTEQREDFYASWSSGVASHSTADLEMDAVAARVRQSHSDTGVRSHVLHHVVLSWRPGEMVSEEVARSAVDATIRSLNAEKHQWYAAMHVDAERVHVHLAINRVNPINYKLLHLWQDHARLARAAEWVEREHGCLSDRRMNWRAKGLSELDLSDLESFEERELIPNLTQFTTMPAGAVTREADAVRQAGYSWVALLSREAIPSTLEAISHDATWETFHANLATYNVIFERAGSGGRIVGAEIGQHVKASRVGLKLPDLEARLGPYVEPKMIAPDLVALRAAVQSLGPEAGWEKATALFAEHGFAFEQHANGARLVTLAYGTRIPFSTAGLSYQDMEKQWGPLQAHGAVLDREAREDERRAEGLRERAALVIERPEAILDRLSETRSLWSEREIGQEIARLLHLDYGEPDAQAFIAPVIASVVEHDRSIELGDDFYSTVEIVEEERTLHTAAERLVEQRRPLDIAPADASLDQQQQRAYAALTAEPALALVSGIAGAGKSRLLRSVAASYTDAGYRVIGTAVSGDAARTLREEAEIDTRTVAKLVYELTKQRETLTARDVIIVDEASTLGSRDAALLLTQAANVGARVLMLGDVAQHGSVARGRVFADLLERHGGEDMERSRRATQQWMRDVASDLRTGRTVHAMDVLRKHGVIAEHPSHEQAKESLIHAWQHARAEGQSALLIAGRRSSVLDLNQMARAAIQGELGAELKYTTAYGERRFAVGDKLVAREPHRQSQTVNGDLFRVAAHREDGLLECIRVRDEAAVLWDVHEYPSIDYGYATTSYRSQGQTVDRVLVLAEQADDQRGVYVGVTRAREQIVIAYGQDEISDFGTFLDVSMRDRMQQSVAGHLEVAKNLQRVASRERTKERNTGLGR